MRYSYLLYLTLLFFATTVVGQTTDSASYFVSDLGIKVTTNGRLLKPNKLVMTIEVELPKNWKLDAEQYGSLLSTGIDTFGTSITYTANDDFRLMQRLKAARKPSIQGFYYEPITFAQTIAIDTSKLPITINAAFKWKAMRNDEKQRASGTTFCLLEIKEKRDTIRSLHAGWKKSRRHDLFLEDVL